MATPKTNFGNQANRLKGLPQGTAGNFTGSLRIDPLFAAPESPA